MAEQATRTFSLEEIGELRRVLQLQALEVQGARAFGAAAISSQSNVCSAESTGNCTSSSLVQDLVAALRPQARG